ncbi:MAG: PhoH family protein [Treponema sp.]|jgi:phosphate starvation-inducible PhoH-like protein|nr:PhoH family protein [Treponema sp.]
MNKEQRAVNKDITEGITIALDNGELLSGICGANDGNLRIIESCLGGCVSARGNEIYFNGTDAALKQFKLMIDNMITALKEGDELSGDYIRTLAGEFTGNFRDSMIQIPHGLKQVYPRSKNQALYVQGMREYEICFCVGPAGTGKTYLAIAHALQMLLSKKMRKLVLSRPVVEAGENLGFLPGDLGQKIDPYLKPLHDAMESLIPFDVIKKMEETRALEIAPLAYMRGRSLNDCMVILDEAQNTTKEQMKMFLTRIGTGTRAIITGDTTQIDLPRKSDSGLLHALEILRKIEDLNFTFLHTNDVMRNPLIKKIIQAYSSKEQ